MTTLETNFKNKYEECGEDEQSNEQHPLLPSDDEEEVEDNDEEDEEETQGKLFIA